MSHVVRCSGYIRIFLHPPECIYYVEKEQLKICWLAMKASQTVPGVFAALVHRGQRSETEAEIIPESPNDMYFLSNSNFSRYFLRLLEIEKCPVFAQVPQQHLYYKSNGML